MSQSYENIECIVIDDASSDGTEDEINIIKGRYEFIYIRIPNNESCGGNHARNVGIEASNGEYVAFLDDDDEWFKDKIVKQINCLQQNLDCKICYCLKDIEYNMGEMYRTADCNDVPQGDLSKIIFTRPCCLNSTIMVFKDLLIEVGAFDESLKYWQDYELCMRLFQRSKVCAVPESLVMYRVINSDKERLTNNYIGFEDTVNYIYKKHEQQIRLLTPEQKKQKLLFYYNDVIYRCHSSGLYKREREFLLKKFKLTHYFKDFIKYLTYKPV
jgi:glycosyltransferase involved in cell wall biosynthesis